MNPSFFCNKCGAQNAADAQFCVRCGAPVNPTATVGPGAASSAVGTYAAASPSLYSSSPTQYSASTPLPGIKYGGFWIRVAAAIIDAIILRVVVAPVGFIFGSLGMAGMMTGLPHRGLRLFGGGLTFILLLFGSWLYEAFMESSSYQATVGKMIFGMKVTDLNGNRISFERATGRHFAKWLSGVILGIGYIMVGFTERKQGLHDLLASTLVPS